MSAELIKKGDVMDIYLCDCGDTFTKPLRRRYDMTPKYCKKCNVKERSMFKFGQNKKDSIAIRPYTDVETAMIQIFKDKQC